MPTTVLPRPAVRRLGLGLAVLGWIAIAALTLTPGSGGIDPPFGCVVCGPDGGVDAIANVLLFVPLGAGLAWAGLRGRVALALVAATTLAVEALQLRMVTGRDTSLGDLVWNTVGGALGFWVVRRIGTLLRPAPAAAAVLAAGWAALWLVGTAATAWSLGPALWHGRWIAHVGATVPMPRGRVPTVLAARVGELPIRRTQWLTTGPALRARLLAGAPVTATAVVPHRGGVPANVLVLTEGPSRFVMVSLARVGDGAQFYMRTRASALRLRSPHFVLRGAFRSDADTVALGAARRGATMLLEARGPAGVQQRRVSLGPNWGWSLLLPPRLAWVDRLGWYTALWVAALVFPIGYWGAATIGGGRRGAVRAAAAAMAIPPVAFVALPALAGVAAVPVAEWVAWLVATALGVALGLAARRSRATPAGLP
ncbi:MAG: hypothetical protein AVDCRST_MAG40-666 [uncultured Gemmatimonadaceae bacterium]|uniref:VanZ-like domain-containing protein n=1 Tax=uncultured Gemmatimonadaceae bacterium TaxID=246130 RepID=A0A6J4KHM6_9BACT|nr:MAG: hypothetical protein AVDCRST_MAG40-666 [uncultured Gemmatimonadaceae bacterium]